MRTRSAIAAVLVLAVVGVGVAFGAGLLAAPGETELDPKRLLATARELLETGPAAEGRPEKDRVASLLARRLGETGASVKRHVFRASLPEIGLDWELENIIASYNPDAKRRLLLGGHWDTRPWADEDEDPARRRDAVPGANDGVSNTAVLLEIARLLGANPPPAELGVDVVLFDGEEGPKGTRLGLDAYFLGSKELSARWRQVTGRAMPEAGVVLDMIGRRGQAIRRELRSFENARAVQDELFAIAKERDAKSFVDEKDRAIFDDHLPFQERGVPVALLIDLDDPSWHTTGDVIENLDPAAMAEVGDVVLAWIARRAAAPSKDE